MKAETEQYYLPKTPKKIADTFVVLRQPKPDRDKDYSALFDSVMSAVCSQLKEHTPDAFNIVWTSSLFPERISQNVLRLVEQEVRIQIEKDRVSESELMITVRADAKDYDPSERVCFLEGAETVLRQLRYRPINLD